MNNLFKIISMVLMIILILILVWVLANYYKEDPYTSMHINTDYEIIDNSSKEVSNKTYEFVEDSNTIENVQDETEVENTEQVIEQSEELNNSEDENYNRNEKITPSSSTLGDAVVISSSEKTSNTEKQEILNEIDKALMELFQVVDKVQTVDETRLGIDEGEVHE